MCPKNRVGVQSSSYLSQLLTTLPETKCLPQPRSFSKMSWLNKITLTYRRNRAWYSFPGQIFSFFTLICYCERGPPPPPQPTTDTQNHPLRERRLKVCLRFWYTNMAQQQLILFSTRGWNRAVNWWKDEKAERCLVSFAAVFRLLTRRSSPQTFVGRSVAWRA